METQTGISDKITELDLLSFCLGWVLNLLGQIYSKNISVLNFVSQFVITQQLSV